MPADDPFEHDTRNIRAWCTGAGVPTEALREELAAWLVRMSDGPQHVTNLVNQAFAAAKTSGAGFDAASVVLDPPRLTAAELRARGYSHESVMSAAAIEQNELLAQGFEAIANGLRLLTGQLHAGAQR